MREGEEGRAQGRGSAEERLEPPHSYHRRWVIWYIYAYPAHPMTFAPLGNYVEARLYSTPLPAWAHLSLNPRV